jgi:hypothetical protein
MVVLVIRVVDLSRMPVLAETADDWGPCLRKVWWVGEEKERNPVHSQFDLV